MGMGEIGLAGSSAQAVNSAPSSGWIVAARLRFGFSSELAGGVSSARLPCLVSLYEGAAGIRQSLPLRSQFPHSLTTINSGFSLRRSTTVHLAYQHDGRRGPERCGKSNIRAVRRVPAKARPAACARQYYRLLSRFVVAQPVGTAGRAAVRHTTRPWRSNTRLPRISVKQFIRDASPTISSMRALAGATSPTFPRHRPGPRSYYIEQG